MLKSVAIVLPSEVKAALVIQGVQVSNPCFEYLCMPLSADLLHFFADFQTCKHLFDLELRLNKKAQ